MPPSRDLMIRLHRLRELFLAEDRGDGALPDYWRDDGDLRAYDRVFAARIGWKWDAAMAECEDRGWRRDDHAVVLDYGCGTGIAARRFARRFGAREVLCHDRSPAAMRFAARAVVADDDRLRARAAPDLADVRPDVLLVSHVLGELDERGAAALQELIARSRRVVLVEPGNKATSRRLGELRARLLPTFAVIAPCPHATDCPALARRDDWCHFFAAPPPEVFTTGEWVLTARELGIDLRSLPYAFLALDREPSPLPAPPHRLLGRSDLGKHEHRVQLCTAAGLQETRVAKRHDPATFRALKKEPQTVRWLPPAAP
ncbi:MAG: methyltransferase domain-containing protein [Planctomycetes bacterium]|nr:methyltransferase domain-containing protein [Planctomycetota bacterium]MCB9885015.1 methyltransferase domain-containing protein [Planctomycetota bacterium]